MKIKLSELRHLVRKSLAKISEDYEVAADGSVDLKNPTVLWNNTFDMHDQETMNKVANRRINLNEPDPKDEDEVDRAIRTLMGSGVQGEAKKVRKGKKDSNGCDTPFAIDKYAKKKSKYKDKDRMSMKEALPPQFLKKKKGIGAKDTGPKGKGWQGEKDDDDDQGAKKKKMKAQIKGKEKGMRGPGGKPVKEDQYPDKDGWQGETYRDPDRCTKPGKKKKNRTTMDKMRKEDQAQRNDETAPVGMKHSLKKCKKDASNPFVMSKWVNGR